ncbi:MAG: hypothetical protein WB853_10300, partial [Desulfobacterales bacterium]
FYTVSLHFQSPPFFQVEGVKLQMGDRILSIGESTVPISCNRKSETVYADGYETVILNESQL